MGKIIGIGGIIFKSEQPKELMNWYKDKMGFNIDDYGTNFVWRKENQIEEKGFTLWGPTNNDSDYFGSKDQSFMINFIVEGLYELLEEMKSKGVKAIGDVKEYDYGKFVQIIDLEGNRIELWEPVESEYEKIVTITK